MKQNIIRINKGLKLPIVGKPKQVISTEPPIQSVALIGPDYIGLKPRLEIKEGDNVKLGQVLFIDKKRPEIKFTSPGAGKVISINRGEKRALLSVVISLRGNDSVDFASYPVGKLSTLSREQITENLLNSGLWTSLRTRPFSHIPNPQTTPHAIFVNAMDTNPLSPSPDIIINESPDDFMNGLILVSKLTSGKTYLCHTAHHTLPTPNIDSLILCPFSGPHPAGLAGTHIHFLDPVDRKKTVWHLNYQDVIAVGKLFKTGKLPVNRVVSIAGPGAQNPRLVRTRIGASIEDITSNSLHTGDLRIISGSVFYGHHAKDALSFLGRYHLQVSVLFEGRKRSFLGWLTPGFNRFSKKPIFISKFLPKKSFAFTTSKEGGDRAMVPIGVYEKVVPLKILPAVLLKALTSRDYDQAEALGCLELDEGDLALCTFVCPSKYDFGPILRHSLDEIEKEML